MLYQHPNFDHFSSMPKCRFVPAPADSVLPDGFMCTTNLPTYVHIEKGWVLAKKPRMDSHLVWVPEEEMVYTKEFRCIRKGDLVAVAEAEDGTEGVLVWEHAFAKEESAEEAFGFMRSDVSREKPIDYESILELFRKNRGKNGYIIWVIGPALVHARGREAMKWMINNDYVHAVLTGKALSRQREQQNHHISLRFSYRNGTCKALAYAPYRKISTFDFIRSQIG